MFTITPEAFGALDAAGDRAFLARLDAFLRESVPALANEPAATMDAQLRLAWEEARRWGLTSEAHVATYVLTAALLGPDFVDRFPAAHAILSDATTPARKAEELEAFGTALFDALDG